MSVNPDYMQEAAKHMAQRFVKGPLPPTEFKKFDVEFGRKGGWEAARKHAQAMGVEPIRCLALSAPEI